jgi:hypothetical protein
MCALLSKAPDLVSPAMKLPLPGYRLVFESRVLNAIRWFADYLKTLHRLMLIFKVEYDEIESSCTVRRNWSGAT